ncbi:hypothetical protein LQL77_30465 [Rhodococcus cerastii]|nr:hypothetical protein [Rhodococcus cerastii]
MSNYWSPLRDVLISLALIVVGVIGIAHSVAPWGYLGGTLLAILGFTGLMVIYFDDPPSVRDAADSRRVPIRAIWTLASTALLVSVISVHAIHDDAWSTVAAVVTLGVALCWRPRLSGLRSSSVAKLPSQDSPEEH